MDGWRPAAFTVEQHASSPFPLEGGHTAVACASCHVEEADPAKARAMGRAGVDLRPAHGACTDCHADAHAGQLARRAGGIAPRGGGIACEGCHTVKGWKPAGFTAEDHRSLEMALDGAHAKAACAACHGPKRPGLPALPDVETLGRAGIAFRLAERNCTDCHADPHDGRFSDGAGGGMASRDGKASCLDCHTMEAFRPSTLDPAAHARFGFPIEGAHRAVACSDCHTGLEAPPAPSSLVLAAGTRRELAFAGHRTRCEECHTGPHGDQFTGRTGGYVTGCVSCHTVEGWKPAARFDHDRDATFALKGSHARVACARCHQRQDEAGHPIYRPVPSRCEECHVAGSAGMGGAPS
jgi:hypothetical protein